jgi:hypothetical protein
MEPSVGSPSGAPFQGLVGDTVGEMEMEQKARSTTLLLSWAVIRTSDHLAVCSSMQGGSRDFFSLSGMDSEGVAVFAAVSGSCLASCCCYWDNAALISNT